MKKPKGARLSREDMTASIAKIRQSYDEFLARRIEPGEHDDPKAFTAHHAAGRSALNHLNQLLTMTEADDAAADAFEDALSKAQAAMSADRGTESDDDDGDDA